MSTLPKPRYLISILILLLVVLYALYQARSLILGPQISIESHRDGEIVSEPLLILEGSSRNIAWISLNGRQIFTDEEGRFSEKLIVSEGVSIMTFEARDRFGRERVESVRIILE